MNNDLISREALKRMACVKFYTSPYYKHILDLIDNAPTVDALPREYHDRVLDMTVAELQACQANLRPQGEWIRLDLAKRVIAKFKGYLDEDMIERIQIALEKEYEAEMKGGAE